MMCCAKTGFLLLSLRNSLKTEQGRREMRTDAPESRIPELPAQRSPPHSSWTRETASSHSPEIRPGQFSSLGIDLALWLEFCINELVCHASLISHEADNNVLSQPCLLFRGLSGQSHPSSQISQTYKPQCCTLIFEVILVKESYKHLKDKIYNILKAQWVIHTICIKSRRESIFIKGTIHGLER